MRGSSPASSRMPLHQRRAVPFLQRKNKRSSSRPRYRNNSLSNNSNDVFAYQKKQRRDPAAYSAVRTTTVRHSECNSSILMKFLFLFCCVIIALSILQNANTSSSSSSSSQNHRHHDQHNSGSNSNSGDASGDASGGTKSSNFVTKERFHTAVKNGEIDFVQSCLDQLKIHPSVRDEKTGSTALMYGFFLFVIFCCCCCFFYPIV